MSVQFSGVQPGIQKPAFGSQPKSQVAKQAARPAVNFGQNPGQPQVRFGDGGLVSGPLAVLGILAACCACCVGVIALPFIAGKKIIGGIANKAKNLVPQGGK